MTTTTNKSLDQPAAGSANWDVPLNSNFGIIDAALGTLTTINVTGIGSTPVTLTASQYQKMGIVFTGTPSANLTYNLPSGVGGSWIISDSTTGGSSYTITLGSLGGGATISIPRGKRSTVFSDGASIIYSDDNRQGAPGSNTQVVYNSSGAFAASANFTFDGSNIVVAGNVTSTAGNVNVSAGNVNLGAGGINLPSTYGVVWGTSNISATTNGNVSLVSAGTARIVAGPSSSAVNGDISINSGSISLSSTQTIGWGTTSVSATTNSDAIVATGGLERFRFVAAGSNISRGTLVVDNGQISLDNLRPVAWGTTNIQAGTNTDALVVTGGVERFRFVAAGSNVSRGSMYVDTGNLHVTSGYAVIFGNTASTYITGVTGSDITVANNSAETARFFGTNNFSVGVNSLGSYAGSGAIAAKAGYLTQPGDTGGFTSPHVFNINWTGTIAELWIDTVNLGQIVTSSDYRIKRDISPLGTALERIQAIRPVSYKFKSTGIFKEDGVEREGFIAHELQSIIPSAVNGEMDAVNKNGDIAPQSLNLAPILSVAVKAMQEMADKIEDLQAQINELKGAK